MISIEMCILILQYYKQSHVQQRVHALFPHYRHYSARTLSLSLSLPLSLSLSLSLSL